MSEAISDLVGKNVFVRTVTMHHTGHLVSADGAWLVLDDAAWIADSGRFSTALAEGELAEVEPFPGRVYVAAGSVVDVCEWVHELPRKVK